MRKEIFLHTGLAKTGTKFLQHKFFPKLEGVNYIPKNKYHKAFALIEKSKARKILVSQEFDQQFDDELKKWAEIYPQTKIIIVFRRQDSWFASEYRRFVKNGFQGSFTDFIDLRSDKGYFKIKDGLYMPKIRLAEKLFKNPPLVLIYEEFKNEPMKFLKKISLFLGAEFNAGKLDFSPKHKSYEEKQLKLMQKLAPRFGVGLIKYDDNNRLKRFFQRLGQMIPRYAILYGAFLVPDKFLPAEPLIPKNELDEIRNFYGDDWQKTLQYAAESQKKLLSYNGTNPQNN